MRLTSLGLALALFVSLPGPGSAQPIPASVISDPVPDAKFPARLEVVHIPTGGVKINGIAYVAQGAGAHPAFVFFHGLPGNEKNLDLVQAVRRAGWTAVAVNYRGSWGSPGAYRFAHNLEDAKAVLAYLRDPANAKALGIDPTKIVIGGHSMGGWVVAHTASHDCTAAPTKACVLTQVRRHSAAPQEDPAGDPHARLTLGRSVRL